MRTSERLDRVEDKVDVLISEWTTSEGYGCESIPVNVVIDLLLKHLNLELKRKGTVLQTKDPGEGVRL